jgi:CheY-like chemotaxis protein
VDILLLVNDGELREFMLEFLQHHRTTVATSTAEARSLLQTGRYALVIVTNFGIGPSDAVSAIPEGRDYPALFLTGYLDESVEATCRAKKLPVRRVPIAPGTLQRELRLALDEVRP